MFDFFSDLGIKELPGIEILIPLALIFAVGACLAVIIALWFHKRRSN